MAASTISVIPSNSSNTNFRAWGKAISDAIAAGGMIQTADTGQVNWSTVNAPGGTNAAAAYEVWRSNDAAGGLHNFYFKIEYGSGSSINNPQVWLTVGWGSDGSGGITGNATTRAGATISATTTLDCYFAAGDGWIDLAPFGGNAIYTIVISIERTRSSGGIQQDEVFVWFGHAATNLVNQVIPRVGSVPPNGAGAVSTTDSRGWRFGAAAYAGYGADKGIGTLAPQKGAFLMESANIFCANTTDFSSIGMQYTMNVYGAMHTFVALGTVAGCPNNQRILMRYE